MQLVSTLYQEEGPWHMTRQRLFELDKLVSEELQRLSGAEEERTNNDLLSETKEKPTKSQEDLDAVHGRVRKKYQQKIELDIQMDKQRRITEVQSFEEALRAHPVDFEEVTARGFSLRFSRGGIEAKISLRASGSLDV